MTTIIFNGNIVLSNQACIKHNDRGFALGHGLFETILVKNNAIPALDYHWKRLETSAPLIDIKLPFVRAELENMLMSLIKENNLKDKLASARVTITHGEADRSIFPVKAPSPNFVIAVSAYTHTEINDYSALIVNTRKNEQAISSRIKSISYLDNILAKQEALKKNYHEAILLNTASNIADGAIFNVFVVKDNQITTPKITDGALPGVIRSILLKEFQQDFPITEKSISVPEILDADEVFLTNALMGIQPVSKLNTKKFETCSMTNHIASLLRERKNYF